MIIFSLPAKVPLFLVKNKQTRFFLLISSFYSNIYCIFALTNALVAKLVDALDLGSSGLGRVGSSPIRRTEENPLLIDIGRNSRHITTFFDLNQQIPIFYKKTR